MSTYIESMITTRIRRFYKSEEQVTCHVNLSIFNMYTGCTTTLAERYVNTHPIFDTKSSR